MQSLCISLIQMSVSTTQGMQNLFIYSSEYSHQNTHILVTFYERHQQSGESAVWHGEWKLHVTLITYASGKH